MPCDDCDRDDYDRVEIQVIKDVLDIVEVRLCERERCGWRLTVARSQIYATVLHAVIVSARESHRVPATLDRAAILDSILDGADPPDSGSTRHPVDDVIRHHIANMN
ncbi:hypothetical protein [Nocardia sp. NPDC051981]|uniref:hypothetical protein n=1 Tax=Nocardia sp. NPDC051981 TaxID=3155417 RepID=UPI00344675CA